MADEKAKNPANKVKASKVVAMIRRRNKDVFDTSGADVRKNSISRFGMGVFMEQAKLLAIIDALTGGDPKTLDSVQVDWPEEKESESTPETDE